MCEVYERLIARGMITLKVCSKLNPLLGQSFDVIFIALRPQLAEHFSLGFSAVQALLRKEYYGEHSMHVLLNCKLPSSSHIFEVRLSFRSFHQLERSVKWMCDWRQLLRQQHHFLPGEENHYQGQVCDKA